MYGFLYASVICVISYFIGNQITLPWQPVSVIGIAVAFYLGFKNNSSYDRTWEARKIWGGIVNDSRSFGAAVTSFVKGENQAEIHKELIYRHVAWLTALRHQLRLSKTWEHTQNRLNDKFAPTVCEDYTDKLESELIKYISADEIESMDGKANIATQIIRKQSERLQELREKEYFEDFRHMEFYHLIRSFYDGQGKAERIKNFPFPRQYASTALWLTLVFCAFVPVGLLDVFKQYNNWLYWLTPLVSALLIWVFMLMEKIGDYSENPFEGTYNDVPITSIARGIEIDIREMINDQNIPKATEPENGFLM